MSTLRTCFCESWDGPDVRHPQEGFEGVGIAYYFVLIQKSCNVCVKVFFFFFFGGGGGGGGVVCYLIIFVYKLTYLTNWVINVCIG